MPKIVDHDARREELLAAVSEVIVRDGLDRVTVRSIAKETGWSSGVLAHYFADKDDMITSALLLAHERIRTRWESKLGGLRGMAALRELVLDNLPLDDERERETRLLINYWSGSLPRVDDVTAGEHSWRRGPRLLDQLAEHVAEAQADGTAADTEASGDIAERLLCLIDGMSLHALLDPKRVTRERQLALATQELDRLAVGSHAQGDVHA